MTPRKYEMSQRARAAEDTRRRILEASLKLHSEKGFVATSWQDIAREADVAIGTVYFHFPTPDDLIPACSALGMTLIPLPSPDIFAGLRGRAQRTRRLVEELFAFYDKTQAPMSHTFAERHRVPAVGRLAAEIQAAIRELVTLALAGASASAVQRADALLDFRCWQAMNDRGLAHREAVDFATALVLKVPFNDH
jgi:AcrR family transcriptional regulator